MYDSDKIIEKNPITNSYVNGRGEHLKFTNKSMSIYSNDPRNEHAGTHLNIDHTNGTFTVTTHNKDKTEKSTKKGKCFLTTACMKFYSENFDDNCYELTMMRWLRDNIVSDSDKLLYYLLAPKIVENIDTYSEEKRAIIYSYIYENVLVTCISLIEQGSYKEAYEVYKNSFMSLAQSFTELPKSNGLRLKKYIF